MKKKTQQGFTLIELLVVIAIIGILATLAVLSLSDARAQARDAKRAHDLRQMQTAVELFKTNSIAAPEASGWDDLADDLSDYLTGGLPNDPGHPGGENDLYIYCASGENYALVANMEKDNPTIFSNGLQGDIGYTLDPSADECTSSSADSLMPGAIDCGDMAKGWFCLGTHAPELGE